MAELHAQLTEARTQISDQQNGVDEAEAAIREYRSKMHKMDEDVAAY